MEVAQSELAALSVYFSSHTSLQAVSSFASEDIYSFNH
jgi:hypothetical protein